MNLQENIRRILREETNQNDGISTLLNEFGLYYVINYMGIKYDDVISMMKNTIVLMGLIFQVDLYS